MEKIVALVSAKAGISEEQATTAVETVANFLKEKMPAGMAGQVDAYLKGEGGLGGIKDSLGGMFGK